MWSSENVTQDRDTLGLSSTTKYYLLCTVSLFYYFVADCLVVFSGHSLTLLGWVSLALLLVSTTKWDEITRTIWQQRCDHKLQRSSWWPVKQPIWGSPMFSILCTLLCQIYVKLYIIHYVRDTETASCNWACSYSS